ncbi:hypothetical protein C8R45DRAFT_1034563 [Mycena sanguinolenta]|nr:hypothetical protein C8R45DRAFT_1034563 [Mycena sanguinolenta]
MASPFASHLGTNYCPKDNESAEIRALLTEPTCRLQRLDDEIAELQKAIDKLSEERNTLCTYVDAHKALISPVRRLPLDIIQEIFLACIPMHRNCVMSASEAPVLLGRICSSWRAISQAMPRLWARLHVVEPQRGRFGAAHALINEKATRRLDIAKLWLERSGQCPLSISLQSGPNYDSPPDTPTSHTRSVEFLRELIPFAGRWQHLKVTTPPFVLDAITHLTAADVPMLESAEFLPHQPNFPPRGVNWEQFGLLNAPRLTSFSTTGSSFNPQTLRALPWHQLTQLTIGGHAWETSITTDTILQTLSQCNELRVCSLVVNNPGHLNPVSQSQCPIVELPSLHTFTLDCGSFPCRVLDRLSLPQLRDFTLRGGYDHSLAPFFGLCTHMETLRIDSNSFTKSTLQESLRALPLTMLHLTIRDDTLHDGPAGLPVLDDDVLALLTPTPGLSGAHVACPVLETLTMKHCFLITDAALLRFVTGRTAMAASSGSESRIASALKRVDIDFNRQMTLDIMPSLAPFIEGGLNVMLSYSPRLTALLSPWEGLPDAPLGWGPGWGFNGGW